MADWYCSSTAYAAVAAWSAGLTATTGMLRRQLATPTVGNERVWRCTTPGTTGGAEPTWTLTKASTTNDNGVVWTECTGDAAHQHDNGVTNSWTAPHARIETMLLWEVAGDRGFVSSDHTQTSATGTTLVVPGELCVQISVDRTAGNIPPLAADITNGAQANTTSTAAVTIQGGGGWQGFSFTCGTGAGSTNLSMSNSGSVNYTYKNCTFILGGTGSSSLFILTANNNVEMRLFGCTFTFGAAGHRILFNGTANTWMYNPVFNGVAPTLIFRPQAASNVEVHGVDFSGFGAGTAIASNDSNGALTFMKFVNCKLSATQPVVSITSGTSQEAYQIDLINCATGNNEATNAFYRAAGVTTTDFSVYNNAGADDIVRNFSWKIVTVATTTFAHMLKLQTLQVWQRNVGSPVTATIEIQSATTLTNKDIWVEWEVLSDAGDVLSTITSTGVANMIEAATNVPTSAAAWTGSGGGTLQKLQSTFTPNMIGLLRAKVFVAKVSATIYVDPKITVT